MNASLLRGLTRLDIVALTINNIVGAGIFSMPAALAAGAGGWSVGVLLLTIALVAMMALCTIEVASRYDVTGGPMYYAGAAFGPTAGFVVGWLMYLSRLAAFGAIATIMLDYGAGLWPALGTTGVRTLAITVFVGAIASVNVRGVVHGALTTNILTVIKALPLILLGIVGLGLGGWASVGSEGLRASPRWAALSSSRSLPAWGSSWRPSWPVRSETPVAICPWECWGACWALAHCTYCCC